MKEIVQLPTPLAQAASDKTKDCIVLPNKKRLHNCAICARERLRSNKLLAASCASSHEVCFYDIGFRRNFLYRLGCQKIRL